MGFWNTVKKAFAWGFGGRLGWMLGGWIGGLVAQCARWVFVAVIGYGGVVALHTFADGGAYSGKPATPGMWAQHKIDQAKKEKEAKKVKSPMKQIDRHTING